MKDAEIIDKEVLVNRFKKVVQEKVKLSNSEVLDWIYLDSPRSIVVVALTPEKEAVLVNLYRHNIRQDVTELPAGSAGEGGETNAEAAKRELLEETGYDAQTIIPLGDYYVLPTETNRVTSYFLALDAVKMGEPQLDDIIEKYWDMSVVVVPFKEILTVVGAGEHRITGVESLLGIRLANEYLQQQK